MHSYLLVSVYVIAQAHFEVNNLLQYFEICKNISMRGFALTSSVVSYFVLDKVGGLITALIFKSHLLFLSFEMKSDLHRVIRKCFFEAYSFGWNLYMPVVF